MQKRRRWFGLLGIAISALSANAAAQQGERLPPAPPPATAPAAQPASAPTPAPAAQPAPAPTPAPASTPAPADASGAAALPTFDLCTPACRAGFVCAQGQCVSACNPPCGAGEHCTAAAACELDAAPPRVFFTPEAAIAPPPDPTIERHDGFMLRLTVGLGYGGAVREVDGDRFNTLGGNGRTEFSGGGLAFSLDIGGSPVDNLVIHGRFADYGLAFPKVERRDVELDDDSGNAVSAFMFGPAVTYYFMPVNIYVTGSVGLGLVAVAIREEGDDAHGGGGIGLTFDVGKEWWVGDQWGLGVAGRFFWTAGRNEDEELGIEADYALTAFAVLFSATYQ